MLPHTRWPQLTRTFFWSETYAVDKVSVSRGNSVTGYPFAKRPTFCRRDPFHGAIQRKGSLSPVFPSPVFPPVSVTAGLVWVHPPVFSREGHRIRICKGHK